MFILKGTEKNTADWCDSILLELLEKEDNFSSFVYDFSSEQDVRPVLELVQDNKESVTETSSMMISFARIINDARAKFNLGEQELANILRVSVSSVERWGRSMTRPRAQSHREQLLKLKKATQECSNLDALKSAFDASISEPKLVVKKKAKAFAPTTIPFGYGDQGSYSLTLVLTGEQVKKL